MHFNIFLSIIFLSIIFYSLKLLQYRVVKYMLAQLQWNRCPLITCLALCEGDTQYLITRYRGWFQNSKFNSLVLCCHNYKIILKFTIFFDSPQMNTIPLTNPCCLWSSIPSQAENNSFLIHRSKTFITKHVKEIGL